MPEVKKFVVITPFHRSMEGITAWCLERAHQENVPFLWMPFPGDALIGRIRSIATTQFLLNLSCDYMIFLDSDIEFRPVDLVRLWEDMKDRGYELIGGVYTMRGGTQLAHYGIDKRIRVDGQITEVAYLSTGFMGIAKTMLQRMVDELKLPLCHEGNEQFRCYPFFESGSHYFEANQEWIYRSEDWDFCDKARQIGVKPYLDTAIRLGHRGEKIYHLEDLSPEAVASEPRRLVVPQHGNSPSGLVLPNGRKKR